ncbi:putative flavin-containing monooxygenase 2 [Diplonema papillatum]|nr:putative flavin-containing monooxygenase 2 [Diplonema papillatum]|eukprot:gene18390-28359_t
MSSEARGPKGYDPKGTDVGRPPSGEKREVLKVGSRVAIVGGGCCGIYTLKMLLAMGLEADVYEQSHVGPGGVWRGEGSCGLAYDTLRTNSSEVTTTAPDFPFPFEPSSPFPHHSEILRYIAIYVQKFNLSEHIKLGRRVVSVSPEAEGNRDTRWLVTVATTQDDRANTTKPVGVEKTEEIVYDAVFTCTGQFSGKPVVPDMKGMECFTGMAIHSSQYRNNKCFKGKNVVVVGIGNSALDIALDTSAPAKSVFIAVRRSPAILSVEDDRGAPIDRWLLTRGTPSQPHIGAGALKESKLHQAFLNAGMPPLNAKPEKVGVGMVKNAPAFLRILEEKKLRLGPSIAQFNANSVTLIDGREIPCDVVVFCTGYDLSSSLRFLAPSVAKDIVKTSPSGQAYVNLYKMCLHPSYLTLCLCGLATTNANEALVGEMQARWTASMLRGRVRTPTPQDISTYIRERESLIHSVDPYHARFVRYVAYMDSLASDIGCLPHITPKEAWLRKGLPPRPPTTEDDLYNYNLHFGPVVGLHWRLNGPDAWEDFEKAREWVSKKLTPGLYTAPPKKRLTWEPPAKL